MAQGYYREVTHILSGAGFKFLTMAKGSHEKWHNPVTGKMLIIPRNLESRHTANGILKDAGLPRALYDLTRSNRAL